MCARVFSVGFSPGLDSMSPARSRRSASHAAGTHGWLPKKTGRPGLRRGGVGGYNLHSVPPDSPPPDCGTPTTSSLYPFGASCQFIQRFYGIFYLSEGWILGCSTDGAILFRMRRSYSLYM